MAGKFNIKLADTVICIDSMYQYVKDFCKEYITDEKADFTIKTEATDIAFERQRAKKNSDSEKTETVNFTDEYLETLSVYRKIAERMPFLNVLLFHGSVIALDNDGYLFTAGSGTGKSTHTRLWREMFGERVVMINDDKPLLRITDCGAIAYGTPWNGKHRLSTNMSVPLKAICILTRSEKNHIEEISAKEAYHMILQQTYRPVDSEAMMKTMTLIDMLIDNMKFYKLGCNISYEAVEVAFEGMNGGLK